MLVLEGLVGLHLKVKVAQSCPTLCDPMDCPWNSLGQHTGVGRNCDNEGEVEVEWFYEDLQDLLEYTQKRCLFLYRGLECKSRKSRNICSNKQIWPWSTKRSRSKANRVLPRECTGHSKQPLPTTGEKTLYMTSPDGQY